MMVRKSGFPTVLQLLLETCDVQSLGGFGFEKSGNNFGRNMEGLFQFEGIFVKYPLCCV